MRLLATMVPLAGLLIGCAAEQTPYAKTSAPVPMSKRTSLGSDPRVRAEYLAGYRTGYASGSSGTMVLRHYRSGYQPNAKQQGFSSGNTDGVLAHLKQDLDSLKANSNNEPRTK